MKTADVWVGLRVGKRLVTGLNGVGCKAVAEVTCDCGSKGSVKVVNLHLGKSCGCETRKRLFKHGQSPTTGRASSPEYRGWTMLRDRCNNENNRFFSSYGGRGIKVCPRWDDFNAFLADMGPRPSPGHSIDRIDGDKGYEPGNCRWATATEQSRNRKNNIVLEHDGKRMCLSEWAAETGIGYATLQMRVRAGWPTHRALTEKPNNINGRMGRKPKKRARDVPATSGESDSAR